MERTQAELIRFQRNLILGLLLGVAVIAWSLLIWQGTGQHMDMAMAMASPTMGMRAPLFLLIWIIMMVAMMFPTAAPMILTFHKLQVTRRERGQPFVATWIFVAGYMVVWSLSGLVAYLGATVAEAAASQTGMTPATAARIGGALLLVAGLYQLTPLKDLCLSKCRTPVGFIMTSWRDGAAGAFRMGVSHGGWCLGCCWLLFLVLFPLGMMNIAAMVVITLVVFAEKTLPWGRPVARATAAVLVIYGIVVMVMPSVLPTFMGDHAMIMNGATAPNTMGMMPMPNTMGAMPMPNTMGAMPMPPGNNQPPTR